MRLADRIRFVLTTAGRVVHRFPAAILLCVVGTGSALCGIEFSSGPDEDVFWRVLGGCVLGLPLAIGLTLATESSDRPWLRRLPELSLLLTAAFTVRFVTLPDRLPATEGVRLATLILASHFSVAVLPFLRRPGDDRYWTFQVRLFLRFLLGGLYAAVLFVGLALALLSVDRLLDLDIDDQRYPQLWFLMAGLFHPFFTLGGVGRVAAEAPFHVSTGLRKFVQFVLVPLTALYLAILYLYAGKITLAWELPNGWVGLPVLILTVVGILGALLLHPWSADAEFPWVRSFTRGFFVLTLPLTGLLALSIGVRVADYGVTEARYYVVLLTAWLIAVCLLRAWRPHRDLRLIPASLLGLALLGSFGPWGASAWSLHSQQQRVDALLTQLGMQSTTGAIQRFTNPDQNDTAQSLANTLRYLENMHGRDGVPASLRTHGDSVPEILTDLALDRLHPARFESYTLHTTGPLALDAPFPARVYQLHHFVGRVTSPATPGWDIRLTPTGLSLTSRANITGQLPLADLLNLSPTPAALPLSELTFPIPLSDGREARVAFQSLTLKRNPDEIVSASFLLALPLPH